MPRATGFACCCCLLVDFTTGVTVAVALGLAGTFLCFVFVAGLPITDSSDSEEYAGLLTFVLVFFFSGSLAFLLVTFLLRAKFAFFVGCGSESVDGALVLVAAVLRTLG